MRQFCLQMFIFLQTRLFLLCIIPRPNPNQDNFYLDAFLRFYCTILVAIVITITIVRYMPSLKSWEQSKRNQNVQMPSPCNWLLPLHLGCHCHHNHHHLCHHQNHENSHSQIKMFRCLPLAIGCYRYILVVHPTLVMSKPTLLRLVNVYQYVSNEFK